MDGAGVGNTFVRDVDVGRDGCDASLSIHQMEIGDVGCVVWDAALVLGYFLQGKGGKYVAHQNVIELGAGTGVVGLMSAVYGAGRVVLTDLPELIPLLKLNITQNSDTISSCTKSDANITAMPYPWGHKPDFEACVGKQEDGGGCSLLHDFGCVLVADCVYYKDAIEPLASTIFHLLSTSNINTKVLCAYEDRDVGDKAAMQEKFRSLLTDKYGLCINYVGYEEMHPTYRSDDIHIMLISKGAAG